MVSTRWIEGVKVVRETTRLNAARTSRVTRRGPKEAPLLVWLIGDPEKVAVAHLGG